MMKNEKDRDKVGVLHICPDFLGTRLYDLLFANLESFRNNIVFVPTSAPHTNKDSLYKLYFLGRDFNILDRFFYFRKQLIIKNSIEERDLVKNVCIIHAHNLFSAGYATWLLSKQHKIPYIVAVRNTDVNVFFRYMPHLRRLGVRIMKDAAAVVFLSPAYQDTVLNKYISKEDFLSIKEKSYIIPNGIDSFFLNQKPAPKQENRTRQLNLLYVGEITRNKNIDTTLVACDILSSMGYDPTLTIIGKIKERKYNNIESNKYVHYYNYMSKEELLPIYRNNDIFVMPSFTETFGLVYIEAMSQGLPVIYSKGQGIDGYFKEGEVGYHINSKDSKELAERVILIHNNLNAFSKRCIENSQGFFWTDVAKKYDVLYSNIAIY